MNSFDYDWLSRSGWHGLLDWIADASSALHERSRAEQCVAAALVFAIVIGAVGAIHAITAPTVTYQGPASPHGWKPLVTVDGKPRPNDHACGSITYGTDPRRSTDPQFTRDALYAARRIASASGIPIRYNGAVDAHAADPGVDVVIAWAEPSEFFNANAIGEAHTNGGGGTILLADWEHAEPGPDGWGAVMLHEWGHIIGLDHVDDPTSIMNPVVLGSGLNAGDRAGLWALGRGSCR